MDRKIREAWPVAVLFGGAAIFLGPLVAKSGTATLFAIGLGITLGGIFSILLGMVWVALWAASEMDDL